MSCLIIFFLFNMSVHAQRGLGTNAPHKSSILELKSTTKGFLMPRLTTLERTSIKNPAEGLLVYCKETKTIFLYADNSWKEYYRKDQINNHGLLGVDVDGNVGINESTDDGFPLTVYADKDSSKNKDGYYNTLRLRGLMHPTLEFKDTHHGLSSWIAYDGAASGGLKFFTLANKQDDFKAAKMGLIVTHAGNVGVGTEIDALLHEDKIRVDYSSGVGQTINYKSDVSTDDKIFLMKFKIKGTTEGYIAYEDNVLFSTMSDYRLKTDLKPIENASDRLMQLNPINFAWKVSGRRIDGFLAHEVDEVVPNAVIGKKDALDKDGNPIYQGIDHSKLIPLLTAALKESNKNLQETLVKIDNLNKRLEAIEAKMKN